MRKEVKYFKKFFVCPNCKSPLYRKSAMKLGAFKDCEYCGKCGAKIASAKEKALARIKKFG